VAKSFFSTSNSTECSEDDVGVDELPAGRAALVCAEADGEFGRDDELRSERLAARGGEVECGWGSARVRMIEDR
jgi:hypothetical protein